MEHPLQTIILTAIHSLSETKLKEGLLDTVQKWLHPPSNKKPDFWETAKVLGAALSAYELSAQSRATLKKTIDEIREHQGALALHSREPAKVIFGTSGWRGRIGEDMTVLNIHRTVKAIMGMMQTPDFLKIISCDSFDTLKKRGIVLLRDNRFMGGAFYEAAARELAAEGIQVIDAGECPTGVGSALVTTLKASGSINFTPSHNPMPDHGIKFNPADGGPAGKEITTLIDAHAAQVMADNAFVPADPDFKTLSGLRKSINPRLIYKKFLEDSKNFDMAGVRKWLLKNKTDLKIIVDYFHGSARGFIEAILGDDVVGELLKCDAISFLNAVDDVSFQGRKPEPSAENQRPIIEALKKSGRRLTLGVFMDPDADRIRFCDAALDVEMSLFGPIMYASLLNSGFKGGVVSTVATTDFGARIARDNSQQSIKTAVGFKWFRPCFNSGTAIIGFEESDGISLGDTLEKDALAGFFGALMTMMRSGEPLSRQYAGLQARYGYYYPQKTGVDVAGVSVAEWFAYKDKVVNVLTGGLIKKGDALSVGGVAKVVTEVNTLDGLKVVFDDDSWLLMRPSGTEPKFRIYYEITSREPLKDISSAMEAYRQAGGEILNKARKAV
ncbi:MAG: hypothetical protein HQM16_17465 [Deltaproteobacteria bacterium]|nr:hypothetical protein [Deltaproteobacteria bacterium]